MFLTIAEVEHVARLARLGLSPDETERLRDQLSTILGHIEVLQQLDTDRILPTAQVNSLTNVLREDEAKAALTQDQALFNAPRSRGGFFEVRAVLGDAESDGGSA